MATKKSTKPKLSKKIRDRIKALPQRKQVYIAGRLDGKTKTQAGIDAGYSKSTAAHANETIETDDVQSILNDLLDEMIPLDLIAQRLREGLDATSTVTTLVSRKGAKNAKFAHNSYVDHAQRGAYIDRYARLKGLRGFKQAGTHIEAQPGSNLVVIMDTDYGSE